MIYCSLIAFQVLMDMFHGDEMEPTVERIEVNKRTNMIIVAY